MYLTHYQTTNFKFKFKYIYFTSIEKQVLTTYTNLSRFCFLGTTPVLAPNVWANGQILDSSKLKEFADNNFKFDENGKKLSKQAENSVGKAEIARYEQFLLFPQSFQKACFPGVSKGVIVWEWVNVFGS